MTLKEKLFNAIFDNAWDFKTENVVPECEQIADNYAIEFAEWTDYLGYVLVDNGWVSFSDDKPKTTQELLEIFKKEKGL